MEFELEHGSKEDKIRRMDSAQVVQEFNKLHREILSLRLSETFLYKLCQQVVSINECLPLCSLQQHLTAVVDRIYENDLRASQHAAPTKQ